ncbi:MAG: DUF3368 domain-containing protein [Nitrospirae bacterium]|nr:DUF3368 domain-containing protein [Nitrospirota bacterium]
MIVVSNTSPLMNLAVINQLKIIEQLYGKVIIPEEVSNELSNAGIGKQIEQSLWIEKHQVKNKGFADSLKLELDAGEAEAIAVAIELKADLLLIDERRGRNIASRFGQKFNGIMGMLIEAKHKGIITSVKPIIDDLKVNAGFWIGNALYHRVLQEAAEE